MARTRITFSDQGVREISPQGSSRADMDATNRTLLLAASAFQLNGFGTFDFQIITLANAIANKKKFIALSSQ